MPGNDSPRGGSGKARAFPESHAAESEDDEPGRAQTDEPARIDREVLSLRADREPAEDARGHHHHENLPGSTSWCAFVQWILAAQGRGHLRAIEIITVALAFHRGVIGGVLGLLLIAL